MSDSALCKAKGCKARIENGGSHDLCPRHSACNVRDKYNPDAYFCPHCLPWLLVLRSTSSADNEKVKASNKLRSWTNQFRRLRLDKRLPGEWVEESSLKKLIYKYSMISASVNNKTVTSDRQDDRNSSEDELKVQTPTYDSQKSPQSPLTSPAPKSTSGSKSSIMKEGTSPLGNKGKNNGQLVKGIHKPQRGGSLQKDHFSQKRKNSEPVCNATTQESSYKRICHEGSKSPSPSVSSDCPSSPKGGLTFFSPDNPVNAMWDFSLQFDSLKAEIKEMHKGIDDLVSSQKCLSDSLQEKIEISFKGIEDMFTKKLELLTKATNSVHDSEVLKTPTQGVGSLCPENSSVNQQVGTSPALNTAIDPCCNTMREACASPEQDFYDDGGASRPDSLRDNYLSVNVPEGSLSFLNKLFRPSEIWETFLTTKKVEWPQDIPSLKVSFEDEVLNAIQKTLCAPTLPNDIGTRQLKVDLTFITEDLLKRDKVARQRLYDILVAITVQEQLAQQLQEITRTEFKDSVPASFLGNLEAHKLAIYSLIPPLREAIIEFFTARLALRNKIFTSVNDNVRVKNLKGSSPFCTELFPESLVSSIHQSLRIANLSPSDFFKEKKKLRAKCKRSLRKRTSTDQIIHKILNTE